MLVGPPPEERREPEPLEGGRHSDEEHRDENANVLARVDECAAEVDGMRIRRRSGRVDAASHVRTLDYSR